MPDTDLARYVDRVLHERVADRLRSRRGALGLSARALSDKSGVPRNVIANFENLRTSMNVEAYFALLGALNVEPDLLMREVVCDRCGGLPPPGLSCAGCGAGREGDPCMACRGRVPVGFICRTCGSPGGSAPDA
jgi:Helix-turn-helix